MKRWLVLGAILLGLVATIVVMAERGTGPSGPSAARVGLRFYVIAHTGPGDPFWAVVRRGAEDAGRVLGIRAIFQGPPRRDVPSQVDMARAAIAAGADGIAISVSDPVAIGNLIREARSRGVPVVAVNVREPPDYRGEPIPYLAYVGMDEYQAGRNLAENLLGQVPMGATVLIAIHEPGHVGLESRARGIAEVLVRERRAKVEKLDITQDPTRAMAAMRAFLKANPETRALFTLGPLGAIPAIRMAREDNLAGKLAMASFDLDPITLQAIEEGLLVATVDQQPYLQGFVSVMQLYLYARYGLQPSDYDTGRGLVTKETATQIKGLVQEGYR